MTCLSVNTGAVAGSQIAEIEIFGCAVFGGSSMGCIWHGIGPDVEQAKGAALKGISRLVGKL